MWCDETRSLEEFRCERRLREMRDPGETVRRRWNCREKTRFESSPVESNMYTSRVSRHYLIRLDFFQLEE